MKKLPFEEYGNTCNSCEQNFALEGLTIDHIFPSESGGQAEFQNLQPLCQPCNNKKSHTLPKIVISHITAELFPPDLDASLELQDKRIDFSCDNRSHPLAQLFFEMN